MDQRPVNRDVLDLFCSWLMVRFEFSDPVARNFRRDTDPQVPDILWLPVGRSDRAKINSRRGYAGYDRHRVSTIFRGYPPSPPNLWTHGVSKNFPAKSGYQRT